MGNDKFLELGAFVRELKSTNGFPLGEFALTFKNS